MQSLLYLIEEGDAHYRSGQLGPALKKYVAVQKVCDFVMLSSFRTLLYDNKNANGPLQIFNEVDDDQYDFHGYSLRKFTINIYLKYVDYRVLCCPILPKSLRAAL